MRTTGLGGRGRLLVVGLLALHPLGAAGRLAPGPVAVHVTAGEAEEPVAQIEVRLGGRYAFTGADGFARIDGVPAGQTRLALRPLGYNRVDRDLNLPAGRRETIEVRLTAVQTCKLAATVKLAGDPRPVVGARVKVAPVDVAAGVFGWFQGNSDLAGKFEVGELPAGKYTLTVTATGCRTKHVDVEVKPDLAPLAIELQPTGAAAKLRVAVTDAVSNQPVAQARVTLAEAWPRGLLGVATTAGDGSCELPAFQQGRLNWETLTPPAGWAGAWNCALGLLLLEVRGQAVSGRWLPSTEGTLQGTVSGDGKQISGTWSQVAPAGLTSRGRFSFTLSADGRSFGGQIGNGDGAPDRGCDGRRMTGSSSDRCRALGNVMVEAAGYQTAWAACSLQADGRVAVALNPTTPQEEREPNSDLATAQEVRVGAPLKFEHGAAGDVDVFRFKLPTESFVRVTVEGNPVNEALALLASDGKVVQSTWEYANRGVTVSAWLRTGTWLVKVNGAGGEAGGAATLRIAAVSQVDPYEPNDTPQAARLLESGQEARGYVQAPGDLDHWRIELLRPSQVRLTLAPSHLNRSLVLFDESGQELGNTWDYSDRAVEIVTMLPPGRYTARVHAHGNEATFEPYALRYELLGDDALDDPPAEPGRMRASRVLEPGSIAGDSTFPDGDRDSWLIPLPAAGRLTVRTWSAGNHSVQVLDATAQTLAEAWDYGGRPCLLNWDAAGPATVYLRVWNHDGVKSPWPHTVQATFTTVDENEALDRDETLATATPADWIEPVRGTLYPSRDVDWRRIEVDRPGWLTVRGNAPANYDISLHDSSGKELDKTWEYGRRDANRALPVQPGVYYLRLGDHGNGLPEPYRFELAWQRCEPGEQAPLDGDAARQLLPGEATGFRFDQGGDVDRFQFAAAAAGKFWLHVLCSRNFRWKLVDQASGQVVTESWEYAGSWKREFEAAGPTRYLLELRPSDPNASGAQEAVLFDTARRELPMADLEWLCDPTDPTLVTFRKVARAGAAAPQAVAVDAQGDGTLDFELGQDPLPVRYPAEGLYPAVVHLAGADGLRLRYRLWVEAAGPQERKGVRVQVDQPSEGQEIDSDLPVRVRAVSFNGARIAAVRATLDGQPLPAELTPPYELEVPWRALGGQQHELVVTATDAKGEQGTLTRRFKVSRYFELQPASGETITGNSVTVTWQGPAFGAATVRYRPRGEQTWQTTTGENSRQRQVALADLEAGRVYEFQPVDGGEPGPIRLVTRVKGLAFGRGSYGATIRRDYDQRVPIAVRNHGEQPRVVKLTCGRPSDPAMLVGFVGEGSEGAPVTLAPGEERSFLLCFSAQDALQASCRTSLKLSGDNGQSDSATVDLQVQLPQVKLVFEPLGPTPRRPGLRYRLVNQGDGLTDLELTSSSADVVVSPRLNHAILPAGGSLEVEAVARLYDGFREGQGTLLASAVGQTVKQDCQIALAAGQSIYNVSLEPQTAEAEATTQRDAALAAAHLNPAAVNWRAPRQSTDRDGDGQLDRFVVDDPAENVRWTGDDTNGDGAVDFAHADVGGDGVTEFSALLGERGWEETNLVEAWLEMGFALPYARSAYEKHDADVALNGKVLGKLRQTIPEGNYTFPIPPTAIAFGPDGRPAANEVQIQSRHLRGGHYVVSSDFRVKLVLTGTQAQVAATSREEAQQILRETPGLVLGQADPSISSEELRVRLKENATAGDPLTVAVTLRNLGAAPAEQVEVALLETSSQPPRELTRVCVPTLATRGSQPLELTCPAPAGDLALRVQLDPEQQLRDADRSNNSAQTSAKVAGDTVKPTLEVKQPADGAQLTTPLLELVTAASDNGQVARVEVRVDDALPQPLGRTADGWLASLLLQPGEHRLLVRAIDTAGNLVDVARTVRVQTAVPEVTILKPAAGEPIDARETTVEATVSAGVVQVCGRVNGGPWQRAELAAGRAKLRLPLRYGPGQLELLAVDARGVQTIVPRPVQCTRQPQADDPPPAPGAPPQPVDVPGIGPVDPTAPHSPVRPPAGAGAPLPVATPDDEPAADEETSEEPDGADPAALDGLDEEEAATANDADAADSLDPTEWLNDEDVDQTADEELAEPELPEDLDWQPADQEDWTDEPVDEPGAATGEEPGAGDGEGGLPSALPPLNQPPPGGGGAVAVQQKQSDWYCTNRPNIGVKFALPEWLMRLKLPKPGTAEFDKALQARLADLRARGIDTSAIEKLRTILQNRCNRLDSPEELPTFLQSLGFGEPPQGDPAALKAWREAMANSADSFLLRLLHSGDPQLIAAGLRARAAALGKFDEAAAESAQAAVETIVANQKLVEDVATSLPYANIAVGLHTLATGETISGEQLGTGGKILNALFTLGPGALKLFRNPAVRSGVTQLGNKGLWVGKATIGKLATRLGIAPEKLGRVLKVVGDGTVALRGRTGAKLLQRSSAAARTFANSPAGRQAAALAKRDVSAAKSLLKRIGEAQAKGDKTAYRKLIGRLQGNKTAQRLLNTGQYSDEFRAALDRTHRAMGRLADRRSAAQILSSKGAGKEIENLLKRNPGLRREDILVRARNVSGNTPKLTPGKFYKYGADRDVVYQFVTKDGRVLKDVHHSLSGPIYGRNLKAITGRTMSKMDHVVTSRWHPEAYNPGRFTDPAARAAEIQRIINGQAAGSAQRARDIAGTISHKGAEWFEAGEALAKKGRTILSNQRTTEGMRQVIKEYDRQVAQYLQHLNLPPGKALPPRLQRGLEIFQKVQSGTLDGSYTVEQAKHALQALGRPGGPPVTPQTIADDLGKFVEFVNQWGLKAAK
ncbi:MAG: hypothetical protein IT204_20580 [Fimbriimonadaceae bacterium]|nr:hypothetical protein [Fimbriimonadaceae bacterium]